MRKSNEKTLVNLIKAMDAQRAVTIRYVKPSTGEVTRRAIEIFGFYVSTQYNLLVYCWDRRSQSIHTFNILHITHYTIHHLGNTITAYTTPVVPNYATILDADTDDVVSVSAWSLNQPQDLAA